MASTITSVVLTPTNSQTLRLAGTATIVATAYDADGNMVVTSVPSTGTSEITFQSADTSVATISPASSVNNTATLTASATKSGATTITATYAEAGAPTVVSAPLSVTVTAVGLSSSVWPKFHGDVGNTGQAAASPMASIVTGSASNSLVIGSQIVYSSPTFNKAGDTMYIGADDDNIYAVTVTGSGVGTVKWSYKTGGAVEAAPLIDVNGTVYVGSQDGNMYALKDGGTNNVQLLYKYKASGPITGSANIDTKGTLYFASEPTYDSSGNVSAPGTIYFLDSLSGSLDYSLTPDAAGFDTSPALDKAQDLVYFGSQSGILYAVSTPLSVGTIGVVRAQYQISGDTISHSSPVIATTNSGEVVYQGTTNGRVYAFRAPAINDGPLSAFSYTATGAILSTPAYSAANQVLVVATYDNSSGQNDSRVAIVDANTGTEITRTTPILNTFADSPNPSQAELSQAQAFLFASSPAISSDGSTVYIGCEDGHVYSISITGYKTGMAATGSTISFTSLIETKGNSQVNPVLIDSSPAIDASGHVYIGGFDGSVYAITK